MPTGTRKDANERDKTAVKTEERKPKTTEINQRDKIRLAKGVKFNFI